MVFCNKLRTNGKATETQNRKQNHINRRNKSEMFYSKDKNPLEGGGVEMKLKTVSFWFLFLIKKTTSFQVPTIAWLL